MTGIRQSIVFQIEDEFGEGNPSRTDADGMSVYYWVAPPPGSYFTSTHRRDTKRIQSTGSKFWDTVAYGPLSGSWEWSFYLDYNYPEPLFLIFEGGANTNIRSRNMLQFSKNNNKRIPSFTIRRKLLNTTVDGEVNEITILKGCVVTNATFSKPSNASYVLVRMTGFYANEELYTKTGKQMDETDFVEYDGNLVEYGCLTSAELSDSDENNSSLIQNTDSVSISIANSAEAVYNTCSAFPSTYSEGISKIQLSASSYSNHPTYYQTGVLSGGKDFNIIEALNEGFKMYTVSKGASPLPDAYLTSYNAMARDTLGIIGQAYGQSTRSSEIHLEDVVMAAITRQKGDNGKLMDSISNCPVRNMIITMKTLAELPYIQGLSINSESWKDLFYSVADRDESGAKTRVNNVFSEYPETIIDQYGIEYEIYDLDEFAAVKRAPAMLSGDVAILPYVTSRKTGITYPVKRINSYAFENRTKSVDGRAVRPVYITSVDIPSTVEIINFAAFQNVSTLVTVTGGVPEDDGEGGMVGGVKIVHSFAFDGCTSLSSCSLVGEDNVIETIYASSFSKTAISEVYIYDGIKEIKISDSKSLNIAKSRGAFADMPNLEYVRIPIQINPTGHILNVGDYDAIFSGSDNIKTFEFTYDGVSEVPNYRPSVGENVNLDLYAADHPEYCPFMQLPWYRCAILGSDADPAYQVTILLSEDVSKIPQCMFYFLPNSSIEYIFGNLTSFDNITEIGESAFVRSGLDLQGMDNTLRLSNVSLIEKNAFINPKNCTSIIIESKSLNHMDQVVVFDSLEQGDSVEIIDLGGCTASNVEVSTSFIGVRNVQTLIVPMNVSIWYVKAVSCGVKPADIKVLYRVYDDDGETLRDASTRNGRINPITEIQALDYPNGRIPMRFENIGPDSTYCAVFVETRPPAQTWGSLGNDGSSDHYKWSQTEGYTWGWLPPLDGPSMMSLSSGPGPDAVSNVVQEIINDDIADAIELDQGTITID